MAQMEFDPKWVRAAKNGDKSAMAALYKYSYWQVYMTIKSMIRSDEDTVMDLLQDTFLKSIDNLQKLGDPSKYNAWIKVIARNTALDYLKRKKPDLFSSYSDEDGTDTFLDPADPDTGHIPDIAMDDQETKRMLQEILEALPERQKITVSMYYYLEMSIKDIARTLGIPEATVKTRLHNGRETIKNKVLEIEKRDNIRLHGIAPIVFFLFLFHKVDAMAMEPDKNILANILNASAASSGTASSPAGKGAATAAKSAGGAATKGVAVKIIAAIAAVAVIGGGAFYGITRLNRNNVPDSASTSSTENTENTGSQDKEDEPVGSSYSTAMDAYRNLLQTMENDPNTLLQCSHLVDLNKDGTDELIVLSDDSCFQLYTFKDGQASQLSEQEMASVFTEDWEYSGITAKEYKEQNGFDAPLQVYLTDGDTVVWVETTLQGDAESEHNYVRITYDGTEASQDDYWEQGGVYQINGQQVDAAEYQASFTEPFHDGRTLTDDTDQILGIEDTEKSNGTTEAADYSSILDEYAGFFSGDITKENFILTKTCQEVAPEFTPWPVFSSQEGSVFQSYDTTAAYKYAYYDIDQDGNEELLMIETTESQTTLLDIWGMSEGKPVLLWTFDSMTYVTLCSGPYLKMTNRGDSWYWVIDYSGWRQDSEFDEVQPTETQYDVPFTELDMQEIEEN